MKSIKSLSKRLLNGIFPFLLISCVSGKKGDSIVEVLAVKNIETKKEVIPQSGMTVLGGSQQPVVIAGKVTLKDGIYDKPVKWTKLGLYKDSEKVAQTGTDFSGEFHFKGRFAQGNYVIKSLTADKFIEPIAVNGDSLTDVRISIRPEEETEELLQKVY